MPFRPLLALPHLGRMVPHATSILCPAVPIIRTMLGPLTEQDIVWVAIFVPFHVFHLFHPEFLVEQWKVGIGKSVLRDR